MWASSTRWVRRPIGKWLALMKFVGNYIAAAILACPTVLFIYLVMDYFLDERIIRDRDMENAALFACWAALSFLLLKINASQHIRRSIAAVLLALPTAFFFSTVINYYIEQMFYPDFHDYKGEEIVLSTCWALSSLWIARAATGRLIMSRGCGVFSMAALTLPIGIALTVMVAPPIQMEILTPLSLVLLSALIGVPLGLFSWGLAHVFRRQEMPNGNESRNWKG